MTDTTTTETESPAAADPTAPVIPLTEPPSDSAAAAGEPDDIHAEVNAIADALAKRLAPQLQALIPADLSPVKRLAWIEKASSQATQTTAARPAETAAPAAPKNPIARMAAGYGQN